MLKIEIIKFEAQDVITTSALIPKCKCPDEEGCFPGGVFSWDEHRRLFDDYSCFCTADKHSRGN